jgi:hypothetical protein
MALTYTVRVRGTCRVVQKGIENRKEQLVGGERESIWGWEEKRKWDGEGKV